MGPSLALLSLLHAPRRVVQQLLECQAFWAEQLVRPGMGSGASRSRRLNLLEGCIVFVRGSEGWPLQMRAVLRGIPRPTTGAIHGSGPVLRLADGRTVALDAVCDSNLSELSREELHHAMCEYAWQAMHHNLEPMQRQWVVHAAHRLQRHWAALPHVQLLQAQLEEGDWTPEEAAYIQEEVGQAQAAICAHLVGPASSEVVHAVSQLMEAWDPVELEAAQFFTKHLLPRLPKQDGPQVASRQPSGGAQTHAPGSSAEAEGSYPRDIGHVRGDSKTDVVGGSSKGAAAPSDKTRSSRMQSPSASVSAASATGWHRMPGEGGGCAAVVATHVRQEFSEGVQGQGQPPRAAKPESLLLQEETHKKKQEEPQGEAQVDFGDGDQGRCLSGQGTTPGGCQTQTCSPLSVSHVEPQGVQAPTPGADGGAPSAPAAEHRTGGDEVLGGGMGEVGLRSSDANRHRSNSSRGREKLMGTGGGGQKRSRDREGGRGRGMDRRSRSRSHKGRRRARSSSGGRERERAGFGSGVHSSRSRSRSRCRGQDRKRGRSRSRSQDRPLTRSPSRSRSRSWPRRAAVKSVFPPGASVAQAMRLLRDDPKHMVVLLREMTEVSHGGLGFGRRSDKCAH